MKGVTPVGRLGAGSGTGRGRAGRGRAGARRVAGAGWRWVLALAVLAAGVGTGSAVAEAAVAGPPGPATGASVAAGAVLYQQNCSGCHGAEAQGGSPFGGVRSADIRGGALRALDPPYTQALLRRAIADGVDQRGQALNSVMPRWAGMLSTSQQREIADYLWSLPASVRGGAAGRTAGTGGGAVPLAPLVEGGCLVVLVGAVVLVARARRSKR